MRLFGCHLSDQKGEERSLILLAAWMAHGSTYFDFREPRGARQHFAAGCTSPGISFSPTSRSARSIQSANERGVVSRLFRKRIVAVDSRSTLVGWLLAPLSHVSLLWYLFLVAWAKLSLCPLRSRSFLARDHFGSGSRATLVSPELATLWMAHYFPPSMSPKITAFVWCARSSRSAGFLKSFASRNLEHNSKRMSIRIVLPRHCCYSDALGRAEIAIRRGS